MKLYLIRHANKESGEDNHLTKKGVKQAKLLAKRLAKTKIDKFYCSSMNRAKETAEIVSRKINLKPKENLCLNEFETSTLRKDRKKWGENEKSKYKELISFLEKTLKNKNSDKKILIIAHGITNRFIISYLTGVDYRKLLPFEHNETGISKFRWSSKYKNWKVVFINDFCHIPERLQ